MIVGSRPARRGDRLRRAVAVAALIDDADDRRQRGQNRRHRLLRRRLVPVAGDRGHDLEIGMFLHALENSGMDRVVDRSAGEAADLQQVAALGLELRHLRDFLLAHVLEVDDDAIGAGLGDDAVEGDDDDAGVASLLDRAVQRVGRGGVDDDRVIALQDQVLDLRRLGRHFLVGGGEDVGRGDDLSATAFFATMS